MGIGAVVVGVLCVAIIIAGSAVSSYQKNISATGTAEVNIIQATTTKPPDYLFITATKQEKNALATATAQIAIQMIPEEVSQISLK